MTVCDSYDALGLVATLKPIESGGTEHTKYGKLEDETGPSTSTRGDPKGIAALSGGAKIPVGYGRILRDEQGNAVDIELADEDGETMDTDRNVETMDHAYLDEKSTTTWTQLGAHIATRARRTNSVVQGAHQLYESSWCSYLADCSLLQSLRRSRMTRGRLERLGSYLKGKWDVLRGWWGGTGRTSKRWRGIGR